MKKSIIAVLLCVCLLAAVVIPVFAAPETVTVTVNFVYDSNKAMVGAAYTAQIANGAEFRHDIAAPKVINYSIPFDKIEGLGSGITFDLDEDGKGTVHFDLDEVNENIVINLYYVAGTATYTVKHYYENLEDDNYTLTKTIQLTGDIDAYTDAVAEKEKGFFCTGVPQTTIAADGSTLVELYYDRSYYTVIFDANGGINGPKPIYAKYGTAYDYTSFTAPTRSGYLFAGWNVTPSNIVDSNVTYVANWLPDTAHTDYAIVFWGQNANDDSYSYLYSQPAHGAPGDEVTWDELAYICEGAHNHSPSCYNLTCGMVEHIHDATACGLQCVHTHDLSCAGITSTPVNVASNPYYEYCGSYMSDGNLIYVEDNGSEGEGDVYYYFKDGKSYEISEAIFNELKNGDSYEDGSFKNASGIFASRDYYYVYHCVSTLPTSHCTHVHGDACYLCGKTAHTHTGYDGSCYTVVCGKVSHTHTADCIRMGTNAPDSNLWHYDHSDTVVISADGSSILNVYFDRNLFTVRFEYDRNGRTVENLTARWGQNVKAEFDAIEVRANAAESSYELNGWEDSTTGAYTNNLIIMPTVNKTLTAEYTSSSSLNTMTYYTADLAGNYQQAFTIQFYGSGYYVTRDEYYEIEGFTINTGKSTARGDSCNGAKFYYDRNRYNLYYYSSNNGTPDNTKSVLYEDNIGKYPYTPTTPPPNMESGAIFVGWYQNPECSGEQFVPEGHSMPAANLALYAKWVNGLFKVETFTDETLSAHYTYEGYDGSQEDIVKYTLATAPEDPSAEGLFFIGWFYQENGVEYPFSYTMPITQDYQLYPKFSDTVIVEYTVHYYLEGTATKVADDETRDIRIGTVVTEKAKMGTELNLIAEGTSPNEYFPDKTSTSVKINTNGKEIIFYYRMAGETDYTIRYVVQTGEDEFGNPIYQDLASPEIKTTTYSIVTENYKPIENYTPEFFRITKELSLTESENVIIFVYTPNFTELTITKTCLDPKMDENQTFLFHISGLSASNGDVELDVAINGIGSITVKALPVGSYAITENTNWSWRYSPDEVTKNVEAGAEGAEVSFANTRTDNSPCYAAFDFIRNIFG